MPKRAALYIRVSNDEQALNGYSLDAQENRLKEYAKSKGYSIVDIYRDEGTSARKKPSRRVEFMRMISDVENDLIDVILFIKLDRWFRNISDYYKYQAILDAHHVEWTATEEDYNTSTSQGRLYLNIKLSIAQNESDTTSERIKFVFADKIKRKEVVSGQTKLGYKIVDKHIVKDDNAPIVLDIFNTYLNTHSIRKTMLFINDKYNLSLRYRRIRDILSDESYTGLKYGIEEFCEPIITHDVFDTVKDILLHNGIKCSKKGYTYLFTSLMKCPVCGTALCSNRNKRHSKEYYYYRCNNYTMNKTCTFKTIREDLIESQLLERLKPLIENYTIKSVEELKAPASPPVDASKIKSKLARLKELYVDGMISRDEYNVDFEKLQAQLINANAKTKDKPKKSLSQLQKLLDTNIIDMYDQLDREHKQSFWQSILKQIIINEHGDLIDVVFR